MNRHLSALALAGMLLALAAVAAASPPNPPVTLPPGGCNTTARLTAEPVSLNNTALVKVEATCDLAAHPAVWRVEWMRFDADLLIQDVFQQPYPDPLSLSSVYLYPNTLYNATLVEVRFWSADGRCICAGNASLPSPVTAPPPPTTGGQSPYRYFLFGAYVDDSGFIVQPAGLRVEMGPTFSMTLELHPGSVVRNVSGVPQASIAYQAISVNGVVPGTGLLLHQTVPSGLALVSDGAWEIGPASWRMVPWAGLTLTYNELRIPPGNAEAGMRIYRLDPVGGGWLEMPGAVADPLHNTVSVNVSEMGVYAVFAWGAAATTGTSTAATMVTATNTTQTVTESATLTSPSASETATTATTPGVPWWAAAAALGLTVLVLLRRGPRRGRSSRECECGKNVI